MSQVQTQASVGGFGDPPKGPSLGEPGNPYRFEIQRLVLLARPTYIDARAEFDRLEREVDQLMARLGYPKVKP